MENLTGHIGGRWNGYAVQARWDGHRLRGRVGGELLSKDIDLTLSGEQVSGRIGGRMVGFDVSGEVSAACVQVQLGGDFGGHLTLETGSAFLRGRLAYWLGGKDFNLMLAGQHLTGRIGGELDGKDVHANIGDVPPALAGLAVACAYKALEDDSD